jgi:formate hydrogenlyase transcriptional activator
MNEKPLQLSVETVIQQYRALLEVTESIAAHRDLSELFHDLAIRLHSVVHFDYINVVLHDPERNVMRLHILETPHLSHILLGQEFPIDQSPGGWVLVNQQPLVVPYLLKETRFTEIRDRMLEHDIKSFCMLPLTSVGRRLGALGFGSMHEATYSESDLEFLQKVAKQVAVAVDNALNFQTAQSSQQQLIHERDILSLLLKVNNAVVSILDLKELFNAISSSLRQVLRHEYTSLALYDPESNQLRMHALDFSEGKGAIQEGVSLPIETTPTGLALRTQKPVLLSRLKFEDFPSDIIRHAIAEGVKSGCSAPLIYHNRVLGVLTVASLHEAAFSEEDANLLEQVGKQIAIAVENALAFRKIEELKNKLTEEKLYLEEEIQTEFNFEEIIGHSLALRRVLKQVETVAPTDSTVLIQGETGTGKELIARAIHNLSSRSDKMLVKLNCAAIPTGLLESELFGHERGAFTGAIAQRIGRYELANKGTLFLDEVGDIPLELQPKLLRVLQEREFERLGSTKTIRVDVRLIAATNTDLAQLVADRQFRSDLYYRLNVFPITLPPLRERQDDIPLLVRFFAQKYARRIKKRIETIPVEAMTALTKYHWPGNIRELENFIERAVILSRGPELQIPVAELKTSQDPVSTSLSTLEEAEREHILRALQESSWVISGPSGAAARLGLKRTTLQSRMQKLGIFRPK